MVSGVISEITHDAQWNWFVRGWACSTGSAGSIRWTVTPTATSTWVALKQTLPASRVAAACQASGSAYRYQLPISLAQRQQLGGRKFSVYGQSPQGRGQDRPLANSGVFAIPTATIVGDIGGVTQDGNWNFFIEGWACSVGVDASIDVHVYAGGAAGGGTFVASGRANLATDGNVANACRARGSAYWFKIPLDGNVRSNHGAKHYSCTVSRLLAVRT